MFGNIHKQGTFFYKMKKICGTYSYNISFFNEIQMKWKLLSVTFVQTTKPIYSSSVFCKQQGTYMGDKKMIPYTHYSFLGRWINLNMFLRYSFKNENQRSKLNISIWLHENDETKKSGKSCLDVQFRIVINLANHYFIHENFIQLV